MPSVQRFLDKIMKFKKPNLGCAKKNIVFCAYKFLCIFYEALFVQPLKIVMALHTFVAPSVEKYHDYHSKLKVRNT